MHHHLMLLIDRGHPGVALDHAFAGGHLCRFVVSAIGQPRFALGALALLCMLLQPLLYLTCFTPQTPNVRLLALAQLPLSIVLVVVAMLAEQRFDRLVHLVGLAYEI